MESANFISLGSVQGKLPFDAPEKADYGSASKGDFARLVLHHSTSQLTRTTEERSRIAREVRTAAKKEKKKFKSEAKKQRKENATLNRRMVSPYTALYCSTISPHANRSTVAPKR